MMRARHRLLGAVGLALALEAHAANAAPGQGQLVQPPSIGQPERGSIAGSLSKLAFGPTSLARGTFSLPLPVDAPAERGPLLASVLPAYSAEGGISEWGHGWESDLVIRRHRTVGEIEFTAADEMTGPWGRFVAGDDGNFYPAGMTSMVRATLSTEGWEVLTADGTRYEFHEADADTTVLGTYAWHLSRVETLAGDLTTLQWDHNASGRAFLAEVQWGGRFSGEQYRMALTYAMLATPFTSYVSGEPAVLDRRVTRVTSEVKKNASYVERWHHDLAYTPSPTGPAFYLTSVTKTFKSGSSEPPVTYQYDFSGDLLSGASFADAPALDEVLAAYGASGIQPDRASMTDLERNGLTDMETYLDQTMIRQTPDGYLFEPLPAPTGLENPLCRPAPSATNKPRYLARMHGDADEPNVVVTQLDGTGTQTRLVICDRGGMTQLDQWFGGGWALSANTRLADIDLDQRPDIVRVGAGTLQVLANTSPAPGVHSFAEQPAITLSPTVIPTASWIQDFNGDGRPDLMVRHAAGVVVWRGIGGGSFEPTGTPFLFLTTGGTALSGLSTYEMSHGDFNNDGLSDVILTKNQTVILFTNRGSSFVETPVSAFATIPWTVTFPVIADLSGSGNEQVVMADGTHARVLQLSRPSTGLLVSADDGKGTVIGFGYGRVRPAPGVNQLYSVLESLTVASGGYDTVTYDYDYGAPVWHSQGKYLIGFDDARKDSPFFHETVSFHNDDDIAGVVTGSLDEDERMPDVLRFSARELEPATFHGVPWLRLLSERRGWRNADGSAEVASQTNYLEFGHDFCPVVTEEHGPHGVLRVETMLAEPAQLDSELTCLPASQRSIGTHADPALDFDYRTEIARDDLGRQTSATVLGPDGPITLQQVTYNANNRVASISTPGGGTSTFTYSPVSGQIATATQPDGVVHSVVASDPSTDAVMQQRVARGSAVHDSFARYDGLERYKKAWDSASGSSSAHPSMDLTYVWPTATKPGRIQTTALLDASGSITNQRAELMAADGEVLASAVQGPDGWVFGEIGKVGRSSRETHHYLRKGPVSSLGLTFATLYNNTTLLGTATRTGSGSDYSAWDTREAGVTGSSATSRVIAGGALRVSSTENGAFEAHTTLDSDGRALTFEDQAGVVTGYVYDALGRLRRVVAPSGTQSVDYDGYGRPASSERVGLQRIEWSYDAVTSAVTERRERGSGGQIERSESYSYDDVGRLIESVTIQPSTGAQRAIISYWDGAIPEGGTTPGQVGFVSTVDADAIRKTITRRADGKVVSTRWALDNWRIVEQSYDYHADGSVGAVTTRVADAGDTTISESSRQYGYDQWGRLASCLSDGAPLFTLTYDTRSRVSGIQFDDGGVTFSHDAATQARNGYVMTGAVAGSVAWHLNERGGTASETFGLDGEMLQRNYGYDARSFLVSAQAGADADGYAYDAAGLISEASDGLGTRPITRTPSALHVGSDTYAIDAMGRVTGRDGVSVVYGPSGQIEHASVGGDELSYAYDESGQRVLKYRNGVPEAAYLEGSYLSEDGLVEPLTAAGLVVGVLHDGSLERLPFDRRGTAFGDEDGNLAVASAYGARVSPSPVQEAIDYVQKGYDPDLGLVRMGVRDYDPLLGQFWQPDPLFMAEIGRCQSSPVECNLYGYAKNDPLMYTDPGGTDAKRDGLPADYANGVRTNAIRIVTPKFNDSEIVANGTWALRGFDVANVQKDLSEYWNKNIRKYVNDDADFQTWLRGLIDQDAHPGLYSALPQSYLNELTDGLYDPKTGSVAGQYRTSDGTQVAVFEVNSVTLDSQEVTGSSGVSSGRSDTAGSSSSTESETGIELKVGVEKGPSAGFSNKEKTTQGSSQDTQRSAGKHLVLGPKVGMERRSGSFLMRIDRPGYDRIWLLVRNEGGKEVFDTYVPTFDRPATAP